MGSSGGQFRNLTAVRRVRSVGAKNRLGWTWCGRILQNETGGSKIQELLQKSDAAQQQESGDRVGEWREKSSKPLAAVWY